MRVVVPRVRLLRHLLPGPARRARRPQAGAAPDPLHDERHGPAARPRPRQERPRRRRGDGPAAPARRRRDLRRAGPDGAALVDAAADRRRPRQLRLARRPAGRDALHRVPDGAGRGGDDRLDRRGHRRLQAQLRQPRARAGRCCRRRSPTWSSTAPPASRSAWPPTWRRTTWSRSSRRCGTWSPTPTPTSTTLMRFVPGPDLPTGGKIVGLDGIRDAYETGRGTLPDARHRPGRVGQRAPQGHRGHRAALRRRHREGHRADQGRWCRPRSSRASPTSRTSPTASNGLRLVIEVKNGFVPEALLEQLYKQTPMEDSFGINAVALVDGQPRTLGLKEMLEVFLEPPLRRRTPPLGVPPQQGRRPAAPGRGPAGRDPRHRRGHPADPRPATTPQQAKERLIGVFDLTDDPGRLHPRHAAAPADQVLPARAREGEGRARAHHRGARRDPRRRRSCCGRSSPTSSPRSRRPTAPRAVPSCSSRPASRSRPPRRRSRWPTTRASPTSPRTGLLARTVRRRAARRRRRPRQPRRGRLRGAAPPPAARSARSPRAAAWSRLDVLDLPDAAGVGQPPEPPGRRCPVERVPARSSPASGCSRCPRCAPTAPASRSAPARAW